MENSPGYSPLSFEEQSRLEYDYIVQSRCKRPRLQRSPLAVRDSEAARVLHKLDFNRVLLSFENEQFPAFREILRGESGEPLDYDQWWNTQSNKFWARRQFHGEEWLVKFETLHEMRQLDIESGGIPLLVAVAHRRLESRVDRIHVVYNFNGALDSISLQSHYSHFTDPDIAPQDYLSLEFRDSRVRSAIGQQFLPAHGSVSRSTKENDVQIVVTPGIEDISQFKVQKFDDQKRLRIIRELSVVPQTFVGIYPVQHKYSPFYPFVKITLNNSGLQVKGEQIQFDGPLIFSHDAFPQVLTPYDGTNFPETMAALMTTFAEFMESNIHTESRRLSVML